MGNLVKETFFNGHSDDFRYNSLNQLVTYKTTTNDTYNYEYDKRGNRLGDIGKKENKKYTYSLENQLVEGTNWKGDKSAYSYNALGIRVNNKQTTHSGNVYDRDYVIDYTTVYGIAPTVQNYILPGDINTPADGWQTDTQAGGFDIQTMLAAIGDGFNTLRQNGAYIFVYDYLKNILAVNGKTGTADDAEVAKAEAPKLCINDFVNHFLGRTVDNSHIIGIGDNNHKLPAYAGAGVTTSDAEFADVSVASFENSDIMVISPNYFDQKHIYTDRGQRMEQKTDTAANQNGNGGNIKLLYVHEDIMGNTRYHTKDNGQSYAELEYDVWGNPTSPGMLLNNDNGVFIFAQFTGHIYDTVLDIYFAEARFYDAKNRQWLSSDPMKDGLNWYQYVRANPATWIDPFGLETAYIVVNGRDKILVDTFSSSSVLKALKKIDSDAKEGGLANTKYVIYNYDRKRDVTIDKRYNTVNEMLSLIGISDVNTSNPYSYNGAYFESLECETGGKTLTYHISAQSKNINKIGRNFVYYDLELRERIRMTEINLKSIGTILYTKDNGLFFNTDYRELARGEYLWVNDRSNLLNQLDAVLEGTYGVTCNIESVIEMNHNKMMQRAESAGKIALSLAGDAAFVYTALASSAITAGKTTITIVKESIKGAQRVWNVTDGIESLTKGDIEFLIWAANTVVDEAISATNAPFVGTAKEVFSAMLNWGYKVEFQ